jgi:hypothetical protein
VALFWVPNVDGDTGMSLFLQELEELENRVAELEKALREAKRVLRIYADLGGDAALEYFGETPEDESSRSTPHE